MTLPPEEDPDRFEPADEDQTLPELLGEGAHEDERDNAQWAVGLAGILLFLLVVTLLIHLRT